MTRHHVLRAVQDGVSAWMPEGTRHLTRGRRATDPARCTSARGATAASAISRSATAPPTPPLLGTVPARLPPLPPSFGAPPSLKSLPDPAVPADDPINTPRGAGSTVRCRRYAATQTGAASYMAAWSPAAPPVAMLGG